MEPRYKGRKEPYLWSLVAAVVLLGGILAPSSLAAGERSYQALLNWLEEYRDAEPTFQPGQRLTVVDQEALKPFIPL